MAGSAAAGGLAVGCGVARGPEEWRRGPASGAALNAWVRIAPDGTVTLATPRAEMGQGVQTALAMLIAEELEVPLDAVRAVHPGIDGAYTNYVLALGDDEGRAFRWMAERVVAQVPYIGTGGSTAVRDGWIGMRTMGASARQMLIAAAAAEWQVDAAACRAEAGRVIHTPSGRSAGYGALAAKAAALTPPKDPPLKPVAAFRLVGTPAPRLDGPEKVSGRAVFGIDAAPPGRLYAAIRHPPSFGGRLGSYDERALAGRPGIVRVLRVGEAVAVVADSWWKAERALTDLPIRWEAGPHAALDSAAIEARLARALDDKPTHVFRDEGDVGAALAGAPRKIEAQYFVPYLAHACMEPMNCTALVADGRVKVWVGCQSPTVAAWGAAEGAGVSKSKAEAEIVHLGGGFGRRAEKDHIVEAAAIARALPGKPVTLIWSREEDIRNDVYRPAAMARFRIGLGADGLPLAWDCMLASQSVGGNYGARNLPWGDLGAARHRSNAEGAFDLPYRLGAQRTAHGLVELPVPVGNWRSVGHSQNAFFAESAIDECAAAAGADALAYRLALLEGQPRFQAVLRLAAERAGWSRPPAPGKARGLALHRSFGSIVAEIVEIDHSGPKIRIERVTVAIDCGRIVNPELIAQQMESGAIFGLTAALHGEITLARGGVVQSNFGDYAMMRLAEAPRIETAIVPSAARPGGVGEPATPPAAPALANALAAAGRGRVRRLPLRHTIAFA